MSLLREIRHETQAMQLLVMREAIEQIEKHYCVGIVADVIERQLAKMPTETTAQVRVWRDAWLDALANSNRLKSGGFKRGKV